ncbi:MAG: hypothetical protein E3K36_05395 [Candidatus Brocadia sp.]|nr:hypothetical protein [Candidatus Brocadia sp.]
MLKYVLPCLVSLVTPFAASFAADTKNTPPSIVWEKTLDEAVTKAKMTGKPVLLDFFAPT